MLSPTIYESSVAVEPLEKLVLCRLYSIAHHNSEFGLAPCLGISVGIWTQSKAFLKSTTIAFNGASCVDFCRLQQV